jgi:hypothetical protein
MTMPASTPLAVLAGDAERHGRREITWRRGAVADAVVRVGGTHPALMKSLSARRVDASRTGLALRCFTIQLLARYLDLLVF